MSRRIVVAFSAGNLWAMAQRGERETKAEPLLQVEPVELVDDAVDIVAEAGAAALDIAIGFKHLLDARG